MNDDDDYNGKINLDELYLRKNNMIIKLKFLIEF